MDLRVNRGVHMLPLVKLGGVSCCGNYRVERNILEEMKFMWYLIKKVILKLELNNQISNIIETITEYSFILNSRVGNAQLKIYIYQNLFICRNNPTRGTDTSFLRILDHTQ